MDDDWDPIEPVPPATAQPGLLGVDYPPTLKRQALTNAERQAKFVAARSSLGELPPVKDPERRERCRTSLLDFGLTYCMADANGLGLLKRPPSEKMREYVQTLQDAILGTGMVHVRFPRGAGKTTWVKIAILWAVSYGYLRYVVVFAAVAQLTAAILSDIWSVIEFGTAYGEDFPLVAGPVRAAEGLAQRYQSQTYHGRRTLIKKTATEINLPVVDGSEASGAIISGKGAGGATRGLVRGSLRPDFVLLDDLQTRSTATSATKLRKLVDWITGEVIGLSGERLVNAVMTSTPIAVGDLSEQFADRTAHKEWRLVEYRLVESWPEGEAADLWTRYDELWREGRARDATAFYASHRAAMDEGFVVLDPGNYDKRNELSGQQHARNLLLSMGPDAFGAEYQLQTRVSSAAVLLSPRLVSSRLNGAERLCLPKGTRTVVGFVDVNAAAGITYCTTAFGPREVSAVVDYGRFPGGGRRLVPKNASEHDTQALLSDGLSRVLAHLASLVLVRDDGSETRVAAVWVDIGYEQHVVLATISVMRERLGIEIRGCKGYGNAYYSAGGRHVVQRAEDVDLREWDGEEWHAQNSDVWKERAQRAFLSPPLTPGSCSLWGRDEGAHRVFADEITAETLTDKAVSARGVEFYRWTLRPGADNHFLDTLSGTYAMAGWYRLLDPRVPAEDAAEKRLNDYIAGLGMLQASSSGRPGDAVAVAQARRNLDAVQARRNLAARAAAKPRPRYRVSSAAF